MLKIIINENDGFILYILIGEVLIIGKIFIICFDKINYYVSLYFVIEV